ncbi:universal stress protein [Streptomyces sp. RFCAC02]|uniref:universal stress protein n=1 Tax=Streptomyces sp. RFCAC02 TaxID=2499143 RepID=UPI0010200DA2|nr:universal stress protein [Streptomyces sp. RFCAC02]
MTRPVAVGIDGSPESMAAAEWAAGEAALRQAPLHLVNAWVLAAAAYPVGVLPETSRQDAAQDLVDRARDELTARHPGVRVEARAVRERPAAALLDAADGAQVLAVGSRGLGRLGGFLLGSISSHVVARAACPVVTVRAADTAAPERAAEIVLGVKAASDPDPALLDFAFTSAAGRGLPLRVLHTTGGDDADPSTADRARTGLTAALAARRERHADVRVTESVEPGSAGEVLVAASRRAALVVVGRRSTRPARLGAVAHALLHHAPAPVAVVPHG